MTYQIDQSGKIEQTNKDTIIAYANDNQYAVRIPRKLKRQVQEAFRRHGFISLFIYYLFSVGVFYLLSYFKQKKIIVVDTEYPGKEKVIANMIANLLDSFDKPSHDISFARIGNRPRAHYAAKDVFDKKLEANKILKLEDIIRALKKTDGRLRECLPTLVDAQARSISHLYHKGPKKSRRRRTYGR